MLFQKKISTVPVPHTFTVGNKTSMKSSWNLYYVLKIGSVYDIRQKILNSSTAHKWAWSRAFIMIKGMPPGKPVRELERWQHVITVWRGRRTRSADYYLYNKKRVIGDALFYVWTSFLLAVVVLR